MTEKTKSSGEDLPKRAAKKPSKLQSRQSAKSPSETRQRNAKHQPAPFRTGVLSLPPEPTHDGGNEFLKKVSQPTEKEQQADTLGAAAVCSGAETESRGKVIRKRRRPRRETAISWRDIRVYGLGVLFLAALSLAVFHSGYMLGHTRGRMEGKRAEAERLAALNPQEAISQRVSEQLEAALRIEQAAESLNRLAELKTAAPSLRSLDFLIAIKALQSGHSAIARRSATDSIDRLERVAESKTLLAAFERGPKKLALLNQAIAADPANPLPHFELIHFHRRSGETAKALEALRSTKARLMPVEIIEVIQLVELLMHYEKMADSDLPKTPVGLAEGHAKWIEVYLALRRNEMDFAVSALRKIRNETSKSFFTFMIRDPAIEAFRFKPEMLEFY